MRRVVRTWVVVAAAACVAVATDGASAEEVKTPVSAALILNMTAKPIESRESAFAQSLREDGAPATSSEIGEVMPDGSVRYGRMTVSVKNPCPPGTAHYEPPPLPGRRRK